MTIFEKPTFMFKMIYALLATTNSDSVLKAKQEWIVEEEVYNADTGFSKSHYLHLHYTVSYDWVIIKYSIQMI